MKSTAVQTLSIDAEADFGLGPSFLPPRQIFTPAPRWKPVEVPKQTRAPARRRKAGTWTSLWVLTLTLVSLAAFSGLLYQAFSGDPASQPATLDLVSIIGLWFCCISYLINRYGTTRRGQATLEQTLSCHLEPASGQKTPHVTVLIPSYCEEPRVIQMTLMSAALAIYPARNIVVLIDDPIRDAASVQRSVGAVEEVKTQLSGPIERFRAEHRAWLQRRRTGLIDLGAESRRLAAEFSWLVDWLQDYGERLVREGQPSFSHIDHFFVEAIITPLIRAYEEQAVSAQGIATIEQLDALYARLPTLLCPDITYFQRKEFSNLSHASNKAMNLNAYISLMGKSFRRRSRMKQLYLKEDSSTRPHLTVRRPDYVMTLDADSLIRPNYLASLTEIIEADPRLAVVQTPYLSFPGSSTPVERYAGATTDIQYLVHQGSTRFKASFWVGANALIRYRALQDIEVHESQNGVDVPVFIQDQTVIEDTGSTIDLLTKGWQVHNHFAPLAYSATPADFGALCIQRKRWSNGGLIILGDLWRALLRAPKGSFRPLGLMLRFYYLMSPVIGNICLFRLMLSSRPNIPILLWMALAVLPYFILYSLDLKRMGYRIRDIFSVSSLNLMLLPVAFAGILESAIQLVTGRKTNFVRTPKVEGRTGVPAIYILFHLALLIYMAGFVVQGFNTRNYWIVTNPALNSALILYGIVRYIGVGNATSDVLARARGILGLA